MKSKTQVTMETQYMNQYLLGRKKNNKNAFASSPPFIYQDLNAPTPPPFDFDEPLYLFDDEDDLPSPPPIQFNPSPYIFDQPPFLFDDPILPPQPPDLPDEPAVPPSPPFPFAEIDLSSPPILLDDEDFPSPPFQIDDLDSPASFLLDDEDIPIAPILEDPNLPLALSLRLREPTFQMPTFPSEEPDFSLASLSLFDETDLLAPAPIFPPVRPSGTSRPPPLFLVNDTDLPSPPHPFDEPEWFQNGVRNMAENMGVVPQEEFKFNCENEKK